MALVVALLAVIVGFLLDMSGRAPRLAGTDHVSPAAFVASVPSHGTLCQPEMMLPDDTHSVDMLIGTYGRPVPALHASFLRQGGVVVAAGRLSAGAHEGQVAVPLRPSPKHAIAGELCISLGQAKHSVVFAGETAIASPSSEQIDGVPQAGRVDFAYVRGGRESWWQLLPTLDRRFGLGKAALFGDWTLPVAALLLLAVWIGAVRVLVKELA